ncbi:hypothetical protein PYCC9005_004836 [Savitreella phatthalungensis]
MTFIPPSTRLDELRTSRMRPLGSLGVQSGIFKLPRDELVSLDWTGLDADEHDLTFHGGPDKAIHQYCADHYSFWRAKYPDQAEANAFQPGGFGENFVATGWNEDNVCIGDIIAIGDPADPACALLQVSIPRQPCFKLNTRFAIANLAGQTHKHNRTGWYYRVRRPGKVRAGMRLTIVSRIDAAPSISRLHHLIHRETSDVEAIRAAMNFVALGKESRRDLLNKQKELERGKARTKSRPSKYKVISLIRETKRILAIELEARSSSTSAQLAPCSFANIRLPNGMCRNYSVVEGDRNRFILGVAMAETGQGASRYIHEQLMIGDDLIVNNFDATLTHSSDVSHRIFVVGGVGVTAFTAYFRHLARANQSFEVHYAARTSDDHAFLRHLPSAKLSNHIGAQQTGSCFLYSSDKHERIDLAEILRKRPWNSQVLVCGPERMVSEVKALSRGMESGEIHIESFESAELGGDPFDIVLNGQMFHVGERDSLLDILFVQGRQLWRLSRHGDFWRGGPPRLWFDGCRDECGLDVVVLLSR